MNRAALWALVLLLAGCGQEGGVPASGGAPTGEHASDAILRVPTPSDPGPVDPSRPGSLAIPDLVYPCLVSLRSRRPFPPEPSADLARRWEWDRERGLFIAHLDPGRLWADTSRVTAADVAGSYRLWARQGRLDPSGRADPRFRSCEAINDTTVVLSFEGGPPLWRLLPLLDLPIVPASRIDPAAGASRETASLARAPLSAGPFRVQEWRPGHSLLLAPNPMAPMPLRPLLQGALFELCPGSDARVVRFDLGAADLVLDVPVFRLSELVRAREEVESHRAGVSSVEMLVWNLRGGRAPADLRSAVSLAVNRDRLVGLLAGWRGQRFGGSAAGIWEPGGPPAGDSTLAWSPLPVYDLARARETAGRLRGDPADTTRDASAVRVEILYERGDLLRERLIALLEEDLRLAGLEPAPVPVTETQLRERLAAGRFQAALVGYRPPRIPDLEPLWASWGVYNDGGYASPAVDSILVAVRGEAEPGRLLRRIRRIEARIRADHPVTFLLYRERVDLLDPGLTGFAGTLAHPLAGLAAVSRAAGSSEISSLDASASARGAR